MTRLPGLRGRDDYIITRYAVDRDLILVTNNYADFEALYRGIQVHPGLIVFSCADSKLRRLIFQRTMMEAALGEVETSEPIQEVIHIVATGPRRGPVQMSLNRFRLPDF